MTADGAELVLGVDAGNSKTVAVVADVTGRVLGFGRAGNGDIYGAADERAAVAAVQVAVSAATAMAYGDHDHRQRARRAYGAAPLAHAAFCLAGLDWPADHAFWSAELAHRWPGLSATLHNDGFALLRAGEPAGTGVALSVGTGGAVVARGPEREWSASFWIRDPLGGVELGRAAFDAVVRAHLGIAPATCLTPVLLAHLGYPDVAAMLEGVTSRGGHAPTYAGLARDVLDAAGRGDPVALAIVERQGRALADYATAAAGQVGLRGLPHTVVLGGSVLSSESPALRTATIAALAVGLPEGRPVLTPRSPVVGAVLEALAETVGELTPPVLDRLTTYEFPAAFLLT